MAKGRIAREYMVLSLFLDEKYTITTATMTMVAKLNSTVLATIAGRLRRHGQESEERTESQRNDENDSSSFSGGFSTVFSSETGPGRGCSGKTSSGLSSRTSFTS